MAVGRARSSVASSPGWGEGMATLFMLIVAAVIGPTILTSIVGTVAGILTPRASGCAGFLVGVVVGIATTIAMFVIVFVAGNFEAQVESLDIGWPHLLGMWAAFVSIGMAITIWLAWRVRQPEAE